MQREHVIEGLKASPLAAFWGTVMAGVPWDKVSYFLASLYSLLLIGQLTWKWIKWLGFWWNKRRGSE